MIHVKDLMIGDYLNTSFGVAKIIAIDKVGITFKNKDGEFDIDFHDGDAWMQEIPITPKILEKNGFSQDPLNGHIFIFHEKSGGVIYYEYGPMYGLTIDNLLTTVQDLKIQYVHELQNAFRICGIEKIIEL